MSEKENNNFNKYIDKRRAKISVKLMNDILIKKI